MTETDERPGAKQESACSQTFGWSVATTDTVKSGWKVGSTIKLSGSVPGVFSAEVSVTGEYNHEWSSATTTTQTYSQLLSMSDGQVCAWTSLQMFSDCTSYINLKTLTALDAQGDQIIDGADNL